MRRVLIVDDNALMRKHLAMFLHDSFQLEICGQAQDGVEAVELFQQLKPDLVTLDVTMPRKGGLEALHDILKIDPKAKVLMVSAITDDSFIKQALQAGAKGYIVKPFKTKDQDFIQRVAADLREVLGL